MAFAKHLVVNEQCKHPTHFQSQKYRNPADCARSTRLFYHIVENHPKSLCHLTDAFFKSVENQHTKAITHEATLEVDAIFQL